MNAKQEYDTSIVIPRCQEEGHILDSVREIYKVMDATNYKFEVIFVDDASTDKTKEKILQIAKEFPDVNYLFHANNTGKGGAIADGAKIASGKYIGHLDIDLEVSADYLPKVLAAMEEGSDIVFIKRKVNFSRSPQYVMRDIAGIIYRSLVKNLLRTPYMDVQSGCKFFRRDALFQLLKQVGSKGWFFDTEILARAHYGNYRIKQIPGFYIRNKKKRSTVKLVCRWNAASERIICVQKKIEERDRKEMILPYQIHFSVILNKKLVGSCLALFHRFAI